MNQRKFDSTPAVRGNLPLWIGLYGPSGGGKTFSALRLATGIVSVTGGDIHVIDTESGRARAYADYFRFGHMAFGEPFSSTDYLAAVRSATERGTHTGCTIIDSASHEHEGAGGYLKTQEAELERLAKGDDSKADRVRLLSWAKPSAMRQGMINGLLQLNTNLIFCFRAKEKIQPGKDKNGKPCMIELGWMPIAAPSLLYEMTTNILLLPNAGGVPSWRSEYSGEQSMMKLPKPFHEVFHQPRPLDEQTGETMAKWARGAPAQTASRASVPSDPLFEFAEQDSRLADAASAGTAELLKAWGSIGRDAQAALKSRLDTKHKPVAQKMDQAK